MIGGILLAGAVLAATGAESVASDQPEYMVRDTVYIFGNGYQAGASVRVVVQRANESIVTGDGTGTSGSDIVVTSTS